MSVNQITEKIIGCAIAVHRHLGAGFLESAYQAAMAHELAQAQMVFEREKALSIPYKEIVLDVGFRCDFLVADCVIVECKAVKELTPIDQAQILNYLKITKRQVGLLINFNTLQLTRGGIKRIVNQYAE